MLCEKCSNEIDAVVCSRCGTEVMPLGPFCYQCGGKLGAGAESDLAAAEIPASANGDSGGIDFSTRVLCSDGACIGVVDEKGICKICGKPYEPDKA
jgi:hypothetical protein